MNKEEIKEILDRLYQKSICVNAGGKGCYSPYADEKEWSDDIDLALDYITNLQEENEYFNHCDEEKRKTITNLRYKIERLEEENERLNNIIDELEKYIKENSIYYNTSDGCQWVDQFKVLDKLNELKGDNK